MKAAGRNAALRWKLEPSQRRTTILLFLITVLVKYADSSAGELYRAPKNSSQSCRRITTDLEIRNRIQYNVHTATPCACFQRQMELEYSFQKIGTCYKQWFSENGFKQMCCYDTYGNLLLGPKNGGYLIPDSLEPDIVNIHEACCEDADLCKLFYQTFPSNNCSGSTNVMHATSWGDPEITTVDHHTYSFNGHGEYTFLETDNKSLQIQARTDFLSEGNKDATIFVAFVLADNLKNDTITIVYNRTDKLLYLYQPDGSLWRNSNGSKAPGQTKGFQLFTAPPYRFIILLKQKTSMRQIVFSGGEFMSVTFTTSRNNVTGFKGLAGNWQQGSYIAGNGTMVDCNANTERQMFELGETWTVFKEDSKFNYNITGGNFTYWNGNHTTPRFLQEIAEKGDLASLFKGFSEANITKYNETCRNSWDKTPNIQCLVTIAKTGDVARGEAVRDDAEEKHHNNLIIHNKPPQFKNSTPTFLNGTYGTRSVILDLKLYVTDDFDSLDKLTYKVITELKNYTLENGIFKWNVDEYLRYRETSLTFTVNDTLGFSTARSMNIFYCGCENPSQCDFSYFNDNSSANIQKASCKCPPYSGGLYCEVQLDPCDDFTCYERCNGSFSRSLPTWPCAECPTGRRSFIASYHQTCDNIDECKAVPKPCGQLCNDTDGSYQCLCEEGYMLTFDGHHCDDIDECRLPLVKCTGQHEVCLNTRGNFSCICEPGYSKENGVCKHKGKLEHAIDVKCIGSNWNISMNMDMLKRLYPDIRPHDIYLGEPTCQGKQEGSLLKFNYNISSCKSTEMTSGITHVFRNKLFYVIFDPVIPFLIRRHIWTFAVECDFIRSGTGTSHLHHGIEVHHATYVKHYNVTVALFSDHNFLHPINEDIGTVRVGEDVYVKVSTTIPDWKTKMRLHTCYTRPNNNETRDMDVVLINNGCEVDSNTHIISQSTHETRFVFQDFEYLTNDEGLDVYCNTTFCDFKDYSPDCVQTCHQSPSLIG